MDDQLDRIIQRISQAVQARDYDSGWSGSYRQVLGRAVLTLLFPRSSTVGFLQWNHRLEWCVQSAGSILITNDITETPYCTAGYRSNTP